jgi:serine protease AprX
MVTTLRLRYWSPVAIAVIVAVLMAAVAVPVAAATGRWIVPAGSPLPTGSMVVGSFPVANALVVSGPSAPAGAVEYDAPVTMQSMPEGFDPASPDMVVDSGVVATKAPAVWEEPELGEQAVVALVDTGVANVPALEGAVAGEIDFTGTGGGDGYGHGTFLASLIAGRGPLAPGVAPEAGILSLKVGAADGSATLGSVVSALQWLHGPGSAAGLRIATLAFSVDPTSDAANILNHAADAVASKGIMVVAATGNDGAELSSPANAKHTISVGSTDDDGNVSDESGRGPDTAGVMQPDLTAPGERIAGTLPQESIIAQHATHLGGGLYHGSGTSIATALTAGVAALASSARPDLDGDALAAALGAGGGTFVDAEAAVAAAVLAPQGKPVNAPPWADEPAEHPSSNAAKSNGNGLAGEAEPNGLRWTGLRWTGLRWTGLRWTGLRWTGDADPHPAGLRWTGDADAHPAGLRWTGLRWTGLRWTGLRWTGLRWTGDGWGDADWAFGKWAGLRWTGLRWTAADADPTPAGLRWTGLRWTGLRWTGLRWTGLRWTGLRWTMLEAEAP